MQYVNRGPNYFHGVLWSFTNSEERTPLGSSSGTDSKKYSSIAARWKANENGSISCPPKDLGGCGNCLLELRSMFTENVVVELVEKTATIAKDLNLESVLESPPLQQCLCYNFRPRIISPMSMSGINYTKLYTFQVEINGVDVDVNSMSVTMFAPAFNTHSFSMNQRLFVLGNDKVTALGNSTYNVEVTTPVRKNLAPSGFYLLFVVHQGIPNRGIWVRLY